MMKNKGKVHDISYINVLTRRKEKVTIELMNLNGKYEYCFVA